MATAANVDLVRRLIDGFDTRRFRAAEELVPDGFV